MNQAERNKNILYKYIPEKAVPLISDWIYSYDFKLRIKKSRASKYGDYRAPLKGQNHQITINYDLNKYSFLITLVHEIAHLSNYNIHQHRVKPHGEEWKTEFKKLMKHFMNPEVFPEDVIRALIKYMSNPAASSCSDSNLLRTLKKYDNRDGYCLLEDLPEGTVFSHREGTTYLKGELIRKRFKCKELKKGIMYFFDPLAEVKVVEKPQIPSRPILWPFTRIQSNADF